MPQHIPRKIVRPEAELPVRPDVVVSLIEVIADTLGQSQIEFHMAELAHAFFAIIFQAGADVIGKEL